MKRYIISIYRNEKGDRRNFVGTVEDTDVDGKMAFTSMDELWDILNQVKRLVSCREKRSSKRKPGTAT